MAAAHNRKIELGRDLTDDEMVEVLGKGVKTRRESIEIYRAAGREDRAAPEEAEIAILTEFLPAQLSADEVESLARAAIAETGASGPADMGRVMGRVTQHTKGRADGRMVHDMYLWEVKKPSESKYAWDYLKLVKTIPAAQAFMPLEQSTCYLVKKG